MMENEHVFLELPMTLSSNHLYSSFRGRLIKSKKAREYDREIEKLQMHFNRQLNSFRQKINKDSLLKIDRIFIFKSTNYFTKKNELKKIDVSNRVKQLDDTISKLIGVDDSRFIDGRLIKTYTRTEYERVLVKISIMKDNLHFITEIVDSLK